VEAVNGLIQTALARYAMTRQNPPESLSATTKGQIVTQWKDSPVMDAGFFQPSDGGDQ
jgi:hypothetical protein